MALENVTEEENYPHRPNQKQYEDFISKHINSFSRNFFYNDNHAAIFLINVNFIEKKKIITISVLSMSLYEFFVPK